MAKVSDTKPRHGWFSRFTFGTVSLVLAGLLALSYVSMIVNPAKAWIFTIFGLLFVPLVVLTFLFFIWALFRRSRMTLLFPPVTLSAKWMVVAFAAIELLTGVTGLASGIAHFAHLGGMLIGWLMILWWRRRGVLFDKDRI